MTRNRSRYVRLISLLVIFSLAGNTIAWAQDAAERARRRVLAQQNKEQARRIENASDTGIFVDTPKIYDDFSLHLMLTAARARLASLQTFDQTGLLARIGSITGATLQQQAISAQVLGPTLPSTATTSLGATGSTTTVDTATGGTSTTVAPSGTTTGVTSGTGLTTTTVAGVPVQNVTTTSPQLSASAPALPQSSVALPSQGFNVSSLDALNEMMQLTAEIANLQLLLEGSLSDRYVRGQRLIKPRTTIGFPITVTPQREYKDAVAVVEVEALNPPQSTNNTIDESEPPAVTALLPREKTYNVAAITDNMTSIGGGLVSHVINGGFSLTRGRKTYYIVQDQDTLATMHESPDPKTTLFSWQFRPVLGRHYVRPGLKQTFVQLANPIKQNIGCFGMVRITTYWRKYDRKYGVLKEVYPETIRNLNYRPIPAFDQTPIVSTLDVTDIGSGQVLATLKADGLRFLSGVYVRVGNNYYREGSPGFSFDATQIRFVAPASELAKHGAYFVLRDGRETPVLDPRDPEDRPPLGQPCGIGPPIPQLIVNGAGPLRAAPSPRLAVEVTAFDASSSILTANLTNLPPEPALEDYYVVVGGRVFGLSDAPVERCGLLPPFTPGSPASRAATQVLACKDSKDGTATFKVVLPSNLLLGVTQVEVKPFFWKEAYTARAPTEVFRASATSDKAVLLEQTAAGALYLLLGNRLTSPEILSPSTASWANPHNITESDTLRVFMVSDKSAKQIVLRKGPSERPIILTLPVPAGGDSKPALTVKGSLVVGMEEVTVQGDNLDKLKRVRFNETEIRFSLSKDKKSVTLVGLAAARVTAAPQEQELEFEFEDGKKASVKVSVFSGIYEIIEKK
ncbi:MAG TPA: hypothetical protein VJS44_22530 [Pyrinomonadaceae bacterium]|nr:hypothetical protein [Pyrinomonadaceae bacterium]